MNEFSCKCGTPRKFPLFHEGKFICLDCKSILEKPISIEDFPKEALPNYVKRFYQFGFCSEDNNFFHCHRIIFDKQINDCVCTKCGKSEKHWKTKFFNRNSQMDKAQIVPLDAWIGYDSKNVIHRYHKNNGKLFLLSFFTGCDFYQNQIINEKKIFRIKLNSGVLTIPNISTSDGKYNVYLKKLIY
jgi:hypothetical protein